MSRPYLHHPIQRLEEEFENQKSDPTTVRALRAELDHRRTQRALRLRAKIDRYLMGLTTAVPARTKGSSRRVPRPETVPVLSSPRTDVETCPTTNPHPPQPTPPTNRPEQLLDAWTALEVLSPFTFSRPEDLSAGVRENIEPLRPDALPWLRGRRSRPGRRVYYQVVLGALRMEAAVARLLERYGDSRPERPSARGLAALAVVILDSRGVPVASPAVAVSSFGWGLMTALNGRLAELARWAAVGPDLIDRLEGVLRGPAVGDRGGKDENGRPVDWAILIRGFDLLVRACGLPDELTEPPTFAVCSYTYYRDPAPPEPLLLNSFFLGDLAASRRLVASGREPLGLARYLGRRLPPGKTDLLRDEGAIRKSVSPGWTPPARWPGPGQHPLALMQQAAVNLAAHELSEGGVLGVNGPPGTGKTTLLRDIVAYVVAARAEAMCRFDDPAEAFVPSGERIGGGGAWLNLYRVRPDVRGHEILVASSNNKAVENVSRELPALGAVADDTSGLGYFRTLSDAIHGRPTWGLIAAVLGNAENRFRFRSTFWSDTEVGMSGYLAAASGTPPQIEERDPTTGALTHRPPRLVTAESPPTTRGEALARWRKARDQFRQVLERSRDWQRRLVAVEGDLSQLPGLTAAERDAARLLAAASDAERACHENVLAARAEVEHSAGALAQASAALDVHMRTRPGLIARMVRTPHARSWRTSAEELTAVVKERENALSTANQELGRVRSEYEQATAGTLARKAEWETAARALTETEDRVEQARAIGVVPVDDILSRPHPDRHQSSPWHPPAAQTARDDVFRAAIELHRAFIDAAAVPIRHNLGALMGVMGGRRLRPGSTEPLLGDLWATLFLVVPIISTTFASVDRMLGRLAPESLGWLLIDEAGQASPQAAVGALFRARRAVVVGDPVQIEPVVTLPDQLTRAISLELGVDPDRYAAPTASVQTLADGASPYTSEFPTRSGTRDVGVPLLVHRRCSDPMFGIANAVAYEGLMVSAKVPGRSPIRDILGPSAWLHVEGQPEDNWCGEEGERVLALLGQLAAAGLEPDLYIVTPFVAVAERLRRLVRDSGVVDGWRSDGAARDWVSSRIGTVHTVQGREAEAVILVLGAPVPSQAGARAWAGGRPNLLNVAVTRAREVLYVIGNRRLWGEAGVFRTLDERLPTAEALTERNKLRPEPRQDHLENR